MMLVYLNATIVVGPNQVIRFIGFLMSELHSSIRKSSVWVVVRLVISLTFGAFITTFIIRSLSVEEYGVYTVLYSLIGYVGVFGSFGIPTVFGRFIPEALQKKQYSLLKRLIFRGLILRLLLSAATVGIILLLHGPIGTLLKLEGFLDYFSIFALGVVLSLEAGLMTSVLHSLFLHKYSVIASTVHTLFHGGCVFVLLREGLGIYGILWAEVASWGLWNILLFCFYYVKFLRVHRDGGVEVAFPMRRYMRYGSLAIFNKVGGAILGASTDFFIITAFLGPGAVALYAFASRVMRLFMNCMPHVVFANVIGPSFFTKHAESGSNQHLQDMFNLLVKMAAFCVFPLTAGMFALGDKMIVIVFKPEYLAALPILLILITFAAIDCFSSPANLVLQAVERIQVNLYAKVFAIYNLVVEIIVIQWFGVLGVVLVTCSANLMTGLFLYYFAKKYTALRIDWCGLFSIAINSAVMGLSVWPLRPFATGFVSLAMVAAVGVATYLVVSWLNKPFTPQERGWVNRVAPRPIFVF